jgi:hypothetical protein
MILAVSNQRRECQPNISAPRVRQFFSAATHFKLLVLCNLILIFKMCATCARMWKVAVCIKIQASQQMRF